MTVADFPPTPDPRPGAVRGQGTRCAVLASVNGKVINCVSDDKNGLTKSTDVVRKGDECGVQVEPGRSWPEAYPRRRQSANEPRPAGAEVALGLVWIAPEPSWASPRGARPPSC